MPQNQQTPAEDLPPFVVKDPETNELKVQLKTLPDALFDYILADTSREEVNGPDWYKLRTGVTALRMVRQEVASGSSEAPAVLEDPEKWQPRMPIDWEQYVETAQPQQD